ncbi:MAG: alpha/beta hydrolase [Idiomarina sp.]|nr:alpha/beta hydrolase [Idiomarina sp.]
MKSVFAIMFVWCAVIAAPVAAHESIEIRVQTPDERVILAGTFVKPRAVEAGPVIIFVTGSGDHPRDGVISGTPMFKVLAETFADEGIASLRLDDRGTAESTGPNTTASTTADRVQDMIAAVDFLAQDFSTFNTSEIILVGLSEGAMIAPSVANQRPSNVSLLVLLGTPALPGKTVWVDQQVANFVRQFGVEHPSVPLARNSLIEIADLSIAGGSMTEMEELAVELFGIGGIDEETARSQGMIEGFSTTMLAPWRQYFLSYDPRVAYVGIKQPVLAVYGSLDTLTSAALNAEELLKALLMAPTNDFTVEVMPGQDHFFLRSDELEPGQHAFGKMHVSPELITRLKQWINARI